MGRPSFRYLSVAAFALLLLAVSLFPAPDTGGPTPALLGVALDKWVHAGSYGVLTALLARARQRRELAAVALMAVLATGYGASIELLQGLVPTRSLSGVDMLANAVGAGSAAGLWLAVEHQTVERGRA